MLIHPLADYLDIPLSNVYANTIIFNENGESSHYQRRSDPLTQHTLLYCVFGGAVFSEF